MVELVGGHSYGNGAGGGGGGAGGYRTGTVTVSSTGGNSITVGAGYPTLVNNSRYFSVWTELSS